MLRFAVLLDRRLAKRRTFSAKSFAVSVSRLTCSRRLIICAKIASVSLGAASFAFAFADLRASGFQGNTPVTAPSSPSSIASSSSSKLTSAPFTDAPAGATAFFAPPAEMPISSFCDPLRTFLALGPTVTYALVKPSALRSNRSPRADSDARS